MMRGSGGMMWLAGALACSAAAAAAPPGDRDRAAVEAVTGRFLIALQDSLAGRPGALLRRGTARAMATPVLGDYGLGVTVMERGGRPIVTHGGANDGFESRFFAFLDGSRPGLVIMTNGDNGGFLAAAVPAHPVRGLWPSGRARPAAAAGAGGLKLAGRPGPA